MAAEFAPDAALVDFRTDLNLVQLKGRHSAATPRSFLYLPVLQNEPLIKGAPADAGKNLQDL